jgi:hypothetical protein
MVKQVAVALVALGLVASQASVGADGFLARFDGGIGVIPASNGAGPANADGTLPNVKLNVVRGVSPGAGPWRIDSLKADIDVSGRITVRGRGLLLASGNSIGTNANQAVFATLICETAIPFVEHNSAVSVPLDADGDFRIDSTIDSVPSSCASPALLIRSHVTGGPWLAAGLPKLNGK